MRQLVTIASIIILTQGGCVRAQPPTFVHVMSPEMDAFWEAWTVWVETPGLPDPSRYHECDPWTWRLDRSDGGRDRSGAFLGYLGPKTEVPYRIWVAPELEGWVYLAVIRHEAIHALARCTGWVPPKPPEADYQDHVHDYCDGPVWGLGAESVASRAKAFRGRECPVLSS